jgi:hypothetical protein
VTTDSFNHMALKNKQTRAKERHNRPRWVISKTQELVARRAAWKKLSATYALPRLKEWQAFIAEGWTSDGVTAVSDELCGVNVGSKGDEIRFWPPKPATLHDYMFQKGGSHKDFRVANTIFRAYLLLYVMDLRNPRIYSEGRVRRGVAWYYWGVRTRWAFRAFNLIPEVVTGRKII